MDIHRTDKVDSNTIGNQRESHRIYVDLRIAQQGIGERETESLMRSSHSDV
jgi:hypothetical protein